MVGSHIDITDLKRAEAALRARDAELFAAQRIQEHLLPEAAPDIPGYDIAGGFHSAEFAAGDHFDFLNLPDGSWGVVIGDVSGHGFSSALLMASTHAHIRSIATMHADIGELLGRVNSVLCSEFQAGRFVTMLLARINVVSGALSYINSGHPTGYVLAGSGAVKAALKSTTLPLGIDEQPPFTASRAIQLEAGDVVFLCTDGLLEAMSPAREMFGADRGQLGSRSAPVARPTTS